MSEQEVVTNTEQSGRHGLSCGRCIKNGLRNLCVVSRVTSYCRDRCGARIFKEYFPQLISTDVIPTSHVDVICDASSPFQSGSVGALVMVDVLHHLPKPLEFWPKPVAFSSRVAA